MTYGRLLWTTALLFIGASQLWAQYEIPGTRPSSTAGSTDLRPTSAYDLKPEHGAWLIIVKSFKGERELNSEGVFEPDLRVKELAESFAEFIRKEYRINAYVYPRGWELRRQRDEEAKAYRDAARKYYKSQGIEPTREMLRVKTINIPDEFTVFVAPARVTLKDREMALEFAKQVRQLKAPSEFNDSLVQGSDNESIQGKGSSFNAFLASMPGSNPTIPKTSTVQMTKADDFMMKLNSGERYSLLHKTRKSWSLLVQSYGGGGNVVQAGATGTDNGEATDRLERAALQAQNVVEMLRKGGFDAYIMHTRYHSMVFVGDFESADDPQLKSSINTFAKMQLKDKSGKVLDTFMERPVVAQIPRP